MCPDAVVETKVPENNNEVNLNSSLKDITWDVDIHSQKIKKLHALSSVNF